MNIPLVLLSLVLFSIGISGIVIPIIPDLVVVWLGVFVYALGTGFTTIDTVTVIILGLLSLSTFILDFVVTWLGAKKYGASKRGLLGSLLGGTLGLFLLPPFGFLFGAALGAFVGEFVIEKKSKETAFKAAKGVVAGFLLGFVIKIIIAGIIISTFLFSLIK